MPEIVRGSGDELGIFVPAGDPNIVVEGADIMRPQTPEQFHTHALHSIAAIMHYGGEALAAANAESSQSVSGVPSVISDEGAAALYAGAGAEEDLTRTVRIPCSAAEVEYLESWDPETDDLAGRILKVTPTIPTEDFDADNLTVSEAIAMHRRQQEADARRPEYSWDSRKPTTINVQRNHRTRELAVTDAGVAELIDGARFLRNTAIRMALERDDREMLSKLLPAEHDE